MSCPSYCTQRWTFSVINWRQSLIELSWQHLRRLMFHVNEHLSGGLKQFLTYVWLTQLDLNLSHGTVKEKWRKMGKIKAISIRNPIKVLRDDGNNVYVEKWLWNGGFLSTQWKSEGLIDGDQSFTVSLWWLMTDGWWQRQDENADATHVRWPESGDAEDAACLNQAISNSR